MADGELSDAIKASADLPPDFIAPRDAANAPTTESTEATAAAPARGIGLWLQMAIVLAISQPFFSPISLLLSGSFSPEPANTFARAWLWSVAYDVLVAACVLLVMRWSGKRWSAYGLKRRKLAVDIVTGFLALYCAKAAATVGVDLLATLITDLQGEPYRGFAPLPSSWSEPPHGWTGVAALAVLSIVIGFSEELLYRGYLLSTLKDVLGSKFWSVLVSAAVFGAMHLGQDILTAWSAFLIGLVFGAFFVWTRRLWPLVIAHAMFDFMFLLRAAV
jgi:membrane protease YdiL (CAAX protease family)